MEKLTEKQQKDLLKAMESKVRDGSLSVLYRKRMENFLQLSLNDLLSLSDLFNSLVNNDEKQKIRIVTSSEFILSNQERLQKRINNCIIEDINNFLPPKAKKDDKEYIG